MPTSQPDVAARHAHHPLLTTKLHIPQPRRDLVARPHLFERLSAGLNNKLTLISAPAGFGKTTLVSTWLVYEWLAVRLQNQPGSAAAWVALDAGDNDPVRFWRYVITACQAFDSSIGHAALALLHTAQQPAWEVVLTLLINDLAQLAGKVILVLEDYHVITAPQIHEAVIFLLDHLPTTLHLIMTTRTDPPLPLARLRAEPALHELRATDLRFSPAETGCFFAQDNEHSLTPALLERLTARTEGWVTALRLLALARQGHLENDLPVLEQLLNTLTGNRGHIFAYLVAEVLNAQPPERQNFLLRTSMSGAAGARLTGSLCEALTGRVDSELLLDQLEQANMFLLPLHDSGSQPSSAKWYRYHALFAEAMQHEARRRLGEAEWRALSQRASHWYAEHGLLPEAVEAALVAQDFMLAASLIEGIIAPILVQNEYHTLRRWLDQLPETVLRTHPSLCLSYATTLLFTSDRRAPATMARLQLPLQIAEQHWQTTQNDPKLGEVLAFRAWITRMQGQRAQALPVAKQALALLPTEETQWRGISLTLIGEEELLLGNLHSARDLFTQSRTLWQRTRNVYGGLATTLALAEVCARQGELQQATQFYRHVLVEAETAPMGQHQRQMRSGGAQLGLAQIDFEWNDLETAEAHATAALAIGRQTAYAELHVRATLILARIKQARAQPTAAQQLLYELVAQMPHDQTGALLREVQTGQAKLALAIADLVSAERLISAAQPDAEIARLQQEQAAMLVARLRLAQGQATAALCGIT